MKAVIVIPAYQAGNPLRVLVRRLALEFRRQIIIVNDGSQRECAELFDELAALDGVEVLHHAVNRGKGAALKTAFNHFLLHHAAQSPGVVTADADGQHLCQDILALCHEFESRPRELWLGSRQFEGHVPLRSRFGNELTRHIFGFLVGRRLTDTQTGLRGIPTSLLRLLMRVPANGYEFELEMLIRAKMEGYSITELPIRTVYEDGNKSSHFNVLVDSLKIYFVFLRFSAVSALSALIDFILFFLAYPVTHSVLAATCVSRIVSGAFNFTCGRNLVFRSRGKVLVELLKYVALAGTFMLISSAMVKALLDHVGLNVYAAKLLAEGMLFLASFAIQRIFVFKPGMIVEETVG